jgi:hypothetical protein
MKEIAIMCLKSIITRSFVLPTVLLGGLAAAPLASAAVATNHSGTICKNYNASQAIVIDFLASGTRSLVGATTSVICPLTRNTANTNGARVYVDIKHTGSRTTRCTAYSYREDGALLASTSQSWSGSGFHEITLNLVGAGKSTNYSDYSVLCTIPGNRNGIIMGVDLLEQ